MTYSMLNLMTSAKAAISSAVYCGMYICIYIYMARSSHTTCVASLVSLHLATCSYNPTDGLASKINNGLPNLIHAENKSVGRIYLKCPSINLVTGYSYLLQEVDSEIHLQRIVQSYYDNVGCNPHSIQIGQLARKGRVRKATSGCDFLINLSKLHCFITLHVACSH